MNITINIPQNDYKQPTEVREWVVQMICNYIIKRINQGMWIEDTYQLIMNHNYWSYQLYAELVGEQEMRMFWSENRKSLNLIRIRKCEMEAVFEVLQNGGYFIFATYCSNGEYTFTFTKKPCYDNRAAKRMDFNVFID